MRKLSFGQNQGIVWSSDSNLWGNQVLRLENWVLDRTMVLYDSRTQTYGETNHSDEKTEFWTEPRYCMVLGHKPMGKPSTLMRKLSFWQNQGIVWFSDTNIWGNQPLRWENWVLDRTNVLLGPRTQTYGETNYLDEKTEFWTEPRYFTILGLIPMGKPTT